MKKLPILAFFLLLMMAITSCSTEKLNDTQIIEQMIETTIQETQQAITKKDMKMARNLWGQISQLGIKADENGEKALAESIGQLASTYVYLVAYIEKDDKEMLDKFNKKFNQSIVHLKEQVELFKKNTKTKSDLLN